MKFQVTSEGVATYRIFLEQQLLHSARPVAARIQQNVEKEMRQIPHVREWKLGELSLEELSLKGSHEVIADLTQIQVDFGVLQWKVHYPFLIQVDFKAMMIERAAQDEFLDNPVAIAMKHLVSQFSSFLIDGPTARRWSASDRRGHVLAMMESAILMRKQMIQEKGSIDAETEAALQVLMPEGMSFEDAENQLSILLKQSTGE